MSTMMVVNKEGRRPQYKDYNSFLERYKNGKKDDQCSDSGVSFSLTNSSNNSSSSINSDLNEAPKKGFKEYLDNYNSKRYSPVQPNFIKGKHSDENKSENKNESKTMKTEVYIEINNDSHSVNQISKVFEVPQLQQQKDNNVSKVTKIFEKDAKSASGKANLFNGCEEQKKGTIGMMSKRFEENAAKPQTVVKQPLKKKPSISEMSKVFEESANKNKREVETKKRVYSEAAQVFRQKEDIVVSPKPQIMINGAGGVISPKPQIMIHDTNQQRIVTSKTTFTPKREDVVQSPPPPPPLPMFSPPQTPSPPPYLTPEIKVIPPSKCSSPAPLEPPSCPPPPPPPPPMPVNFTSGRRSEITPASNNNQSKFNTLPKMQTVKTNDTVVDGQKLDKNNPMVKKLVYGALREMYGAYHDKANDYLATLPKDRVRRNNGLDSIINSIASQGGLDKLNGRVNPKQDTE